MRQILVAALLGCGFASLAHAAGAPCQPIQLKPGTSKTTVSGVVSPDDVACYEFSVRVGQRVRVSISSSRTNAGFRMPGTDTMAKHEFRSQQKTYRIRVMQFMPSRVDETYRLSLAID